MVAVTKGVGGYMHVDSLCKHSVKGRKREPRTLSLCCECFFNLAASLTSSGQEAVCISTKKGRKSAFCPCTSTSK